MKYRLLGKTGLKVSEIALGCEGFNQMDAQKAQQVFDQALAAGINFMDMYTPNPQTRQYVSRVLAKGRSNFILQSHLYSVWKNGQYECTRNIKEVKAGFETMLTELNTDYIDIGMIHYVDSLKGWEEIRKGEIMAYATQLQQQGRIHYLGISSHNPQVAHAAVDSPANL